MSEGEAMFALQIRAAQERLHRAIGQWARVGHRRVREKALQARLAMGLPA